VLVVDVDNTKALYRSARACLAIDKVDEALDAITRAINVSSTPAFDNLKAQILKRKDIVDAGKREAILSETRKREIARTLHIALKVLFYSTILMRPMISPSKRHHIHLT
jgi:hypothetical protein